jgi:serine/threonine-protein kinase RsbT
MPTLSKELMTIMKEPDVVLFRNRVRELANKVGMGTLVQTKLITAASELVRNMLKYANGGEVVLEIISEGLRTGVRLTFRDQGPGIADLKLAMQDGYSTGKSLGLGLPGARRLVNEFDLKSTPGQGTTVMILCWKNGR